MLYDNISSNAGPGLDDYEISVYLTTAQLELVKKAYSGGNTKEGFEGNERRRRELSNLVTSAELTVTAMPTSVLSNNSFSAILPTNTLYVLHERAKLSSSDTCLNNSIVEVTPISLDEFDLIDENPFRRASKRRVIRIDAGASINQIELVSTEAIAKYYIKYLKIPSPIILVDLTTDPIVGGLGLTINGQTAPSTCLLNESMHREILNRAVDLAIRDYRENTLQNKIQTELGLDYKED